MSSLRLDDNSDIQPITSSFLMFPLPHEYKDVFSETVYSLVIHLGSASKRVPAF